MSKNGISHLQYKADRQLQKLELAATKRAATGRRSTLVISELPTVYATDDNDSANRIDNPNVGGLIVGRPWIAGSPPPSNAEVIKLDPYDNYNTNTNTIVNKDDNAQVGTITGTTWSTNVRQGGTVTLTSNDTALILPSKTVRTIAMWIKYLDRTRDTTRYLIDSRYDGGNGGYILRNDNSQWAQISINGGNLVSVDSNTLSNLDAVANDWQFVVIVCDQDHTNQMALFNRFTMDEGAAPFQFGLIKAYNYAFNNSDCLTAYQADLSRYAPPSAGLKQITLVDTMQIGVQPNASVAILGIPSSQWTLIRNATQWWATPAGQSPYQMTYSGDNGSGDFTFTIGSHIINIGTSFWFKPVSWPDPGGLNSGINAQVWAAEAWDQTFAWFGAHSPYINGVQGSTVGYTVGGAGNHTVRFDGYFYADQAGTYTFTLSTDQLVWGWFGSVVATPSVSNATASSNGSQHTVTLAQGDFYPLLVIATTNTSASLNVTVLVQGGGYGASTGNWGSYNGWH